MQPQFSPPTQQQYRPPSKRGGGAALAAIGIVLAAVGAILAALTYFKYQDADLDWTTSLAAAMSSSGLIFVGGCVLTIGGAIVQAITRLRS